MNKFTYIFIFSILISCSPIRKGIVHKKEVSIAETTNETSNIDSIPDGIEAFSDSENTETKRKSEINTNSFNLNSIDKAQLNKARYDDTLYIKLNPIYPYLQKLLENGQINYNSEFESALKDFDDGKIELAKMKFNFLAGTLSENDSIGLESRFFYVECLIQENELSISENLLLRMKDSVKKKPDMTQKIYLRLGQINCVLNKDKKAKLYFDLLKNEYPKSKYSKLADCNLVR